MPASRSMSLAATGVFALCLSVYGATLYPTVPGGDAGELIATANALGVVHPPGYPLWTLLAKLFTWIPGGSIAWKVAWLSAVCSSAASALIFACVVTYLGGRSRASDVGASASPAMASGLVGAALFAIAPTTWSYSVGAEVFPLHCFFVALLFFLALRWDRTRRPRDAVAIAATVGLGLTNHLTLIFYAIPIAAWLLWSGRRTLLTPRGIAALAAAGLLGLTPYVYLWIAGASENPLSWGDTATLHGLADHLLRRDYGTFQLLPAGHAASSTYAAKLMAYVEHFSRASLGVGVVLVVAAVFLEARERAKNASLNTVGESMGPSSWIVLLVACALVYIGGFHALANVAVDDPLLRGVLSRFWLQGDVALCILAGVGFGLTCARLFLRQRIVTWSLATAIVVVSIGASGGERADRGGAVVENYGRAILEPLPPRAMLLTQGDLITNAVRYLQSCDGVRDDVLVLDQELMTKSWYVRRMAKHFPQLHFPGDVYHPGVPGGFTMAAFLDANAEGRSIFVYPEFKSGDASTNATWRSWPDGLASRVLPAGAAPNMSQWTLDSAAALAAVDARGWPPLDRYPPGSWERVALEDVWQARHRRAWFVLREAIDRNNDAGLLLIARGEFEAAARMHPDPPWYLLKNLGIVYDRLAPASPWLRGEQLKVWKRYLATAPGDDPDRTAIAGAVAKLEQAGN